MEEILEILDEEGFKTGQAMPRDLVHQLGLWHKEVAVCIVNSKNEFLMQKRSITRKMKPGEWTWAAGHVEPHELPIHAALRELKEEIGIKFNPEKIKYIINLKDVEYSDYNFLLNRRNLDAFLIKVDIDIKDMRLQKEEVEEVKWIPLQEYKEQFLDDDTMRKRVFEELVKQGHVPAC